MIKITNLKDSAGESQLEEQLKKLPESPGVYLMRDAKGKIIYVGKAINLRHRLRSYFGSPAKLTPKTQSLVGRVADFEFFVTKSEQEALILELNLIKRHHPRYNVRLMDDKTYPYLVIDQSESFPQVRVTRRTGKGNCRYFGPYTSAGSMRKTIQVLRKIFPLRSCNKVITGTEKRPCLKHFIGRCSAPCIGAISETEYSGLVKEVILFLEGKGERVVRLLQKRMERASEIQDFEKAAYLRDQWQAVTEVVTEQRVNLTLRDEQDVIAFAQDNDHACVQVFLIRAGKLIGRESFVLQGTHAEKPASIIESFILQFYDSQPGVPPKLLVQHPLENKALIESWLEKKRGGKVRIQVPRRGHKKQFMDIVAENARQSLEQQKIKEFSSAGVLATALSELKEALSLPTPPLRIEGYDISNIQGRDAVGSMVVFEEGKPKSAHYRRFRIKTVPGADDYAMLREVLKRRFKRLAPNQADKTTESWAITPDLVLIDGGKGQLTSALQAMNELKINSIPVASIAKENEEIFIPCKAKPIVLLRNSAGLQLLQRVRDEAHRFAIGYYQRVHKKKTFTSALEGIPGIGSKRRQALLRHFGSVKAIKEAPVAELANVKGITEKLAEAVKESL
ncbi:MAG: excinuclease ABC subunit UvrC [Chloroflexota bacterium]